MRALLFTLILLCFACTHKPQKPARENILLTRSDFGDLKEWLFDDHYAALEAFRKSCKKILALPKGKTLGGANKIAGVSCDWRDICNKSKQVTELEARNFFEEHFIPYKVKSQQKSLFTGYHEPQLRGSLHKTKKYKHPVYKLPKECHRNVPRKEINKGALSNKGLELLYVDDEVDLFYMQIQGSGAVHLENGKVVKLGFAGHNKHNYQAITNYLIKHHNFKKNQLSQDFIKSYLRQNQARGRKIMEHNKSYVYFTINNQSQVVGAHNVALTPERSLAIDNRYLPYGVPLWLETTNDKKPFHKLCIAQDRGGAVKGLLRGDIFFGSSKQASIKASRQKAAGNYFLLLPKHLGKKI
jgi:membrane-bound lytic murein transglycosylase A